MTSLHWQTSLQNRQCHALCTLGRTSKCDKVFATYMSFTDLVYYRLGCDLFVFGAYTNITLCDQNESKSLKGPQTNIRGTFGHKSSSARLMSVIVGYSAAVSHGIFLGLYVLVLKKNPYINKHPLETLFWVSILGTTVSLILMLLVETPVLPSNWFEFTMVIIHSVTCAAIWPLVMYGSGIISGNTVTIIMSTKSIFMLIAQYTVLSSILPGHRNWIEVVGVVLVLFGSSLSSVLEILADTKLISCWRAK